MVYPRIPRILRMVYPQMRTNVSQIDTDDLWVFVYLFVKIYGWLNVSQMGTDDLWVFVFYLWKFVDD